MRKKKRSGWLKAVQSDYDDAKLYEEDGDGVAPVALVLAVNRIPALVERVEALTAALLGIINAYNAESHPCHYKIREAIDASRDALLEPEES